MNKYFPGFMVSTSQYKNGSPVHVAPACAGSGEGSNHFGFYVHSISLHLGLEPMTSWSEGSNFTAAPELPFIY
jgi:hypothetical protein